MKNHFTNLSSLLTYDTTGPVDYLDKFDAFDDAYTFAEEDAGTSLLANLQDRDFRSALNLGGWKPSGDPQAQAIEVSNQTLDIGSAWYSETQQQAFGQDIPW